MSLGSTLPLSAVLAHLPFSGERAGAIIDEQSLVVCDAQRLTEVEALHGVTTECSEHLYLLQCLHTLGDGGDAQALGHADDVFHHHLAPLMIISSFEKTLVEFYDIDGDILEHGERRIATAKVIERDQEAMLSEILHHMREVFDVMGEQAFGKFKLHEMVIDAILVHQIDQGALIIRAEQV